MKSLKPLLASTTGLALLIACVVSLNIIASRLPLRLDVTHDKVYSLSPGTRSIVGKLDHDVTAKLFFSRSLKDLPVPVKTYATRVEEVLREYASLSHGHLTVEVIDPKPDTDDEELAQKYGINAARLPRGDQMYFGVVFAAGAKEAALPYLDPRREEFLEYDLSSTLVATGHKEAVKIGILSSLPLSGQMAPDGSGGGGEWAFVTELRRGFDVQMLPPTATELSPDLKVLLVIHPKGLAPATTYAIDQYVLGGGHLIVAVDPMSRVDLQLSGARPGAQQMPEVASDLPALFKAWGLDYDKGQLVGDAGAGMQINAGGMVLTYPYFMGLRGPALSPKSVITANLHEMLYAEGGSLKLAAGSASQLEPLLTASKESGQISATMAPMLPPQELARQLKGDGQERVLAGILRGKLKTAFPSGPPEPPKDGKEAKAPLAEAAAEAQVLVIADVDFLADQNAAEKLRFGDQTMIRARNDNLSFVANAVDYFAGSDDLIAIRSRGHISRPFTRVAALQKAAEVKWQAEEETLTAQLTDLQKKLNEIQAQRTDGNRMVLTAEQEGEIAKFRDEERRIKQRRREVRKSLREDIEALGRRLLAANLLIVPLAVAIFGIAVYVRRARRRSAAKHTRQAMQTAGVAHA